MKYHKAPFTVELVWLISALVIGCSVSNGDKKNSTFTALPSLTAVLSEGTEPAKPVQPQPAVYEGRIAFTSNRDGEYESGLNFEIYIMNADGTEQKNLTNTSGTDRFPSWSPDGTRITFISSREGDFDIYMVNADGSGLTRLTDNEDADDHPVWLPDGKNISFTSGNIDENNLYIMNPDGTNQINLTKGSYQVGEHSWSPDGKQIVFSASIPGTEGLTRSWDIYVLNYDGNELTGLTNLTKSAGADFYPAWSPDGKYIAFMSERDGDADIYVMNADGSNVTNLTNNSFWDSHPAWSPDGTRIVFASSRDDNIDIYIIDSDGSNETRLTDDPATDIHPVWATAP